MRRFWRDERPPAKEKFRINEQIRIREVRLIDENGQQVGVVETAWALQSAKDKGLDLVEVAPEAKPPVCRILDYGRFKYKLKKKAHDSSKKQHRVQLKEVRLRPKIEEHDFTTKLEKARYFLQSGHRVQVNLIFRGREMSHQEIARGKLERFVALLEDLSKVEQPARMEGRRMILVLGVKPHVLQAIEAEREKQARKAKEEGRRGGRGGRGGAKDDAADAADDVDVMDDVAFDADEVVGEADDVEDTDPADGVDDDDVVDDDGEPVEAGGGDREETEDRPE